MQQADAYEAKAVSGSYTPSRSPSSTSRAPRKPPITNMPETEYEFRNNPLGISLSAISTMPVICKIDPNSAAGEQGIRVGSVIVGVNGTRVPNKTEAVEAIKASSRPLRLLLLPPEAGGADALKAVAAQRASAQAAAALRAKGTSSKVQIRITITNKGEPNWGLALRPCAKSLSILRFSPDGTVTRHNKEKEASGLYSEKIAVHDDIIGVNDVTGSSDELMAGMRKSNEMVSLLIQRAVPTPCPLPFPSLSSAPLRFLIAAYTALLR